MNGFTPLPRGGSGASTFAGLSDAATVDMASINAPLSDALDACIRSADLGSGVANALLIALNNSGGVVGVDFLGTQLAAKQNIITFGTNVQTALAANVGSAGSVVLNGGVLGTPSSGTLTNCNGLPIAGITGLGTGVGTALANAVNGTGGLLTYAIIGTSGATLGLLNTANTWGAASAWALGTNSATPADAISLTNSTAAIAGTQSASPATIWTGQGWKTNSTAASQSVAFKAFVLPVQGTSAPTGKWCLQQAVNGGAYSEALSVTTAGELALGGFGCTITTAAADLFVGTASVRRIQLNTSGGTGNIFADKYGDYAVSDSFLYPHDGAAGVWSFKNGTTQHKVRIFGTTTGNKNLELTHDGTNAYLTASAGQIAFGSAALDTNATTGFLCVPTCAGAPSGTPASIPTGQAPLIVDTTNSRIYAYFGAAWHMVAVV